MGEVKYNYKDLMFFLGQLCVSAAKLDPNNSELCDQYAAKIYDLLNDLSWHVEVYLGPEKEGA